MRLIDADELESKAKTIYMEFERVAVPARVIPISDLHLAPTIDAVKVVRCKDCKHWAPEPMGDVPMCYRCGRWTEPDHFCADGKKVEARGDA